MRLQFQKREIGKPNYPALAAARRRRRKRIVPYVEEADDEANKGSLRARIGIKPDIARPNDVHVD
jgi:hypothetical protein